MRCFLALLLVFFASGCSWLVPGLAAGADAGGPATELPPEERATTSVFDPELEAWPLPSDLYLQGGALVAPGHPASTAEAALWSRIEGRDGWPRQSSVFIPLTRPVDAATPASVATVFDLGLQAEVAVELERVGEGLEGTGVRLVPIEPLRRGRTYVYALTDEALDLDGSPLEPPELLRELKRPRDDERPDLGRELEALRDALAPWLAALEVRGIDRASVVAVGAFTTSSRPTATFDVRLEALTIPSLFLEADFPSPATGGVTVPDEAGVEPSLRRRVEPLDGFSPTSAIRLAGPGALDPDTWLADDALRLFAIHDESAAELGELAAGFLDENTAALTPELRLDSATVHATVLAGSTTVEGERLEADLHTLALLSDEPLGDDAGATVRILAAQDAARLEPARQLLSPLRDELRSSTTGLDDLAAVLPFTTMTVDALVSDRRARLTDDDVPVGLDNVVVATPAERGLWIVMPDVETVVTGRMQTLDWLDPETREDRQSGPLLSPVEVALTIPEGVEPGAPIPVVLFGHGLITSRELVYLVANFLAEAGFASLAIDLPYHGERSPCLGDATCPNNSACGVQGTCLDNDGNVVPMNAIETFWNDDGLRVPVTTGLAFIEPDDIGASRDHVLQALVDLSQAVRVIRGADWETLSGGWGLAGDDIVYLGISLGGILGSSLAAVEEHIGSFALNVPGAGLVELMQESDMLGPTLLSSLEEQGLEPGTVGFRYFEADAKWALDVVDPINLAALAPGRGKRLLIQMAEGDSVVPNASTERLSASTGVEISVYTPTVTGHGFLADPTSGQAAEARQEILEFFAGR